MHILLTGGTGFIGGALVPALTDAGHDVTVLTRQTIDDRAACRYVKDLEDLPADSRFEAVINLAGASLAARRWTTAYKREIESSRLDTTRNLLGLFQRMERPPQTLLNASAIGYYGHHGEEELDEQGASVPGFSQALCQRWEETALEARQYGCRVCLLRLGVVLDSGGGAMEQMSRPFNFGVANWLGDGRQWLSWVHRADVVAAILFLLQNEELSGPFNITAPGAVTSRGFCDVMKKHKRTLVTAPVPGAVMRLMVGEMAGELLLNGQRVVPAALQSAGFHFAYPTLDEALSDIL